VAEHERDHHAYCRGTFVFECGHGVIRLRCGHTPAPSEVTREPASDRTQASLKNIVKPLGSLMIGTSGPIGAGGGRAQQSDRKSSTGIGREGAICEYIEIMQISPVRATMRCL
jgi:hypothetical protein